MPRLLGPQGSGGRPRHGSTQDEQTKGETSAVVVDGGGQKKGAYPQQEGRKGQTRAAAIQGAPQVRDQGGAEGQKHKRLRGGGDKRKLGVAVRNHSDRGSGA